MFLISRLRQYPRAPLSVHLAILIVLFQLWVSRTTFQFPMTVEFIFIETYVRPVFYILLIVLSIFKLRWIWIAGALTALFDVSLYLHLLHHKEAAIFLTSKTIFALKLAQLMILAVLVPFVWIRTRHHFQDEPLPARMNPTVFRRVSLFFAVFVVSIGFALFIWTNQQAEEIANERHLKQCLEEGSCLPPVQNDTK